jgi:lipoprotein-anchoring transpeptidase ErfK/SrfK
MDIVSAALLLNLLQPVVMHSEPIKTVSDNITATYTAQKKLVLYTKLKKLYFYKDNTVYKTYNVAVGKKKWETPVGNWVVMDKIINPGWTSFITGKVYPPGKNNPLGTRWIEFWKDPKSKDSIGFHGTNDINSIGKAASHGCVRMYKRDVEELYDLVDIATPVEVK